MFYDVRNKRLRGFLCTPLMSAQVRTPAMTSSLISGTPARIIPQIMSFNEVPTGSN